MLETTHLELTIVNLFTSIAEQVELQEQIQVVDNKISRPSGWLFSKRKEAIN